MKNFIISKPRTRLYLFSSLIFTLMITSQLSTGQTPSNFSGIWVLNTSKSGTQFIGMSSSVIITQDLKSNTINLDITSSAPGKQLTKKTEKYIIDSNEVISLGNKEWTTITSANWSSDKKKFTVTELTRKFENGITKESKLTSVYSMENKGKTMIITIEETKPEESKTLISDNKITMIFDKAN